MAKKEVPLNHLSQFLPNGTYEPVLAYLNHYKVHLTIAKNRESLLGDYRHRHFDKNHRISVNGGLNKYSFLITLLHELAHLITFEQFGNKVAAHGKEWKKIYGQILADFIEHKIFPSDIEKELKRSLKNPGASTCSEEGLQRVLRNYDIKKAGHFLIEELAVGTIFKTKDGRVFKKAEKRVKRHVCIEIPSGKKYLFSPVYEVLKISTDGIA